MAHKSRDDLIDLVLAQFGQITKLQADNEAFKLKLEKGKKPPTNSSNSSQSPSLDHKPSQPDHMVNLKADPAYGKGVAAALGIPFDKVK